MMVNPTTVKDEVDDIQNLNKMLCSQLYDLGCYSPQIQSPVICLPNIELLPIGAQYTAMSVLGAD